MMPLSFVEAITDGSIVLFGQFLEGFVIEFESFGIRTAIHATITIVVIVIVAKEVMGNTMIHVANDLAALILILISNNHRFTPH
jgi:hypothetical protein